jgi:hypothetical protein
MPAAVSVALLRLVVRTKSTTYNCSYYRIRINQTNSSDLLGLDENIDGDEFYSALLGNAERWGGYMEAATSAQLPASDRRYADTAAALVSGYLNDFRGMTPEYGGGKFWNTYNEYLPLDTLALHGALLEWGQTNTSTVYLEHFFTTFINASTGGIIYGPFGCDSDADYGRLIDTYCKATRYSGAASWAKRVLPIVLAMTKVSRIQVQ